MLPVFFKNFNIIDKAIWDNPDGHHERLVLRVENVDVSIVRYDYDNKNISVKVGSRVEIMPLNYVEGFILDEVKRVSNFM